MSRHLKVTLLIPARDAADFLLDTVRESVFFMRAHFPGQFEIILIPNGPNDPAEDSLLKTTLDLGLELAERFPELRVLHHPGVVGKGAAIRHGIKASLGNVLFYTDADLPYDLDFILAAYPSLAGGVDLVTANRRADESVFDLPLELLSIAYKRHRLGLAFNALVRVLFGLKTSDTQAGFKGMSKRLAFWFCERSQCPGFFFDLELFLICRANRLRQLEIPVSLRLNSEKSTIRVFKQSFEAVHWLLRMKLLSMNSAYRVLPLLRLNWFQRFKSAPFRTRVFLWLRVLWTPYLEIASYFPAQGKILDLGCGHGLLCGALAHLNPDREIIGLDHDPARIAFARVAFGDHKALSFSTLDIMNLPMGGEVSGVALIDTLHYFNAQEQELMIETLSRRLVIGSRLLIREVEPSLAKLAPPSKLTGRIPSKHYSAWRSQFNRFYEKIATFSKFTKTNRGMNHQFRNALEWQALLSRYGFETQVHPVSRVPFADLLFVATKVSRNHSDIDSSSKEIS